MRFNDLSWSSTRARRPGRRSLSLSLSLYPRCWCWRQQPRRTRASSVEKLIIHFKFVPCPHTHIHTRPTTRPAFLCAFRNEICGISEYLRVRMVRAHGVRVWCVRCVLCVNTFNNMTIYSSKRVLSRRRKMRGRACETLAASSCARTRPGFIGINIIVSA